MGTSGTWSDFDSTALTRTQPVFETHGDLLSTDKTLSHSRTLMCFIRNELVLRTSCGISQGRRRGEVSQCCVRVTCTLHEPRRLAPRPSILGMRQCFTGKQGCFCSTFPVTTAVSLL